jgi:hypothetical protein
MSQVEPTDDNDACFCVDESTNANRGPTDKQDDADPLAEKMRKAIEDRCGKATSPMAGMTCPPSKAFDLS